MLFTAPSSRARVFAPGSIGNIGPGLDVLGCAVTGVGDSVDLAWSEEGADAATIHIADPGHPELPTDPHRHAAAIAASAVLRIAGDRPRQGLVMRVRKDLPLA